MARDQKKGDSVFDFLYIDSRRIALFLSQFGSYGHLKALTRSASENTKAGGGIDIRLAKVDYSEGEETGVKKEYDTQWVAPLTFLDESNQRGMMKELKAASIGQLVRITGTLEIRDLGPVFS